MLCIYDCLLTFLLEYTNEEKIAGLKMCESYNLQYGTNYIAVMPAMMRKGEIRNCYINVGTGKIYY